MNNDLIIIIVGETGSGKSFVSRELLTKYPNIEIITKYTTRKSRNDETSVHDVKGDISLEEIQNMNYQYINRLNQEHYAFKKEEIDTALAQGKIPCMDLSNEDAFLKINADYPNKVLILKVVPYMSEEVMKESFERQGRDSGEFEQRKDALKNPLTDWVYKYKNVREIINPSFLRDCQPSVSLDVIARRIESVITEECKKDLGFSHSTDNKESTGLYDYLYFYSKNRPLDQELMLTSKTFKQ